MDGSNNSPQSPLPKRGLAVKQSPMSKRAKKNNAHSKKVHCNHIVSTSGNTPIGGFTITPLVPMMDKHLTHLIYRQADDKEKAVFLEESQAIPRVFSARDKTGSELVTNTTRGTYPNQSLMFNFANETISNIMDFVNDTLAPTIWNHVEQQYQHKTKIEDLPRFLPLPHGDSIPPEYNRVDTWDKAIVSHTHLTYIASYILREEHDLSLSEWVHQDNQHIYCLFTPGKVPQEFIKTHNISAEQLHEKDKPTIEKSNLNH